MVDRLPGFTMDTGTSARGFAGTAGNVLVDGARPTAKTDDLSAILDRIPAAAIDHIEVIRGGAPRHRHAGPHRGGQHRAPAPTP